MKQGQNKFKKILLMCALVVFGFSIMGCTSSKDKKTEDSDYDGISIKVEDTKDLNVIANRLFTQYLSSFKKDSAENRKIKDFKINKIEIRRQDSSSFEFFAVYSVQPVKIDAWLVADGVQAGDWINNKNFFVKVNMNKNTYTIEQMGTSPIDVD